MVDTRAVVHRIEDGVDPRTVEATTYQMRNFYRQMGDGFFSVLDVMNYIQHHQIVKWIKNGAHVLDVCCGRGLLLPMLRYQRAKLGSYTGVDIAPGNATFQTKRVTDGKPLEPGYYPFPVSFVESNVAVMSAKLSPASFDTIVYTSSIEHMHPDAGLQSLRECRTVAKPGAVLVLTCPNTPEDANGYDTQYRAHVYEWKRSELLTALYDTGWKVVTEYGLLVDRATLHAACKRVGLLPLVERLEQFVPSEWLLPVFAPYFPTVAKEIGFVCEAV